jgi:DMSO/TMAO reductase YedYZ molybdopterin-dependent catalytic subunit
MAKKSKTAVEATKNPFRLSDEDLAELKDVTVRTGDKCIPGASFYDELQGVSIGAEGVTVKETKNVKQWLLSGQITDEVSAEE